MTQRNDIDITAGIHSGIAADIADEDDMRDDWWELVYNEGARP